MMSVENDKMNANKGEIFALVLKGVNLPTLDSTLLLSDVIKGKQKTKNCVLFFFSAFDTVSLTGGDRDCFCKVTAD